MEFRPKWQQITSKFTKITSAPASPYGAWLIPLLLLLALLAWYFLHHRASNQTTAAPVAATAAGASMPDLGAVHFATDQATLTPEGQATLTRAADYMKGNPQAHLRVEGYTDATGNDPHNQGLSQRRAATVGAFLVAQGIDKSRLTGEGFGPANPAATNATDNGKADNRRAELFVQP